MLPLILVIVKKERIPSLRLCVWKFQADDSLPARVIKVIKRENNYHGIHFYESCSRSVILTPPALWVLFLIAGDTRNLCAKCTSYATRFT